MAQIRRRSDKDGGGYQVRYYGPDGRRHAKTFARKKDAQSFCNTIEADKTRGAWIDPEVSSTLAENYVASFLDTAVHLRPSTRLKVEGHLRNYILPTFGKVQLGDIRPSDVRAWLSAMVDHGLSPATIRAVHSTFSRVMNQALIDGIITRSPSFGIKLPSDGAREEMNVITPEQIDSLADAVEPRYKALIYMASYTGLRWSELAGLKASNLDLIKRTVVVKESLVEVNGKLFTGTTKTGKTRTVSLPRFLCQMLTDHLAAFPAHKGYVFSSAHGKPLRRNFYRRHFLPALVTSGIDPELCLCDSRGCKDRHTPLLRFHDLRHTCAALLIANGAHPKEIQERLGHSTIRITFDRYGHLFPTLDERLRDGLDEIFNQAKTAQTEAPDAEHTGHP